MSVAVDKIIEEINNRFDELMVELNDSYGRVSRRIINETKDLPSEVKKQVLQALIEKNKKTN